MVRRTFSAALIPMLSNLCWVTTACFSPDGSTLPTSGSSEDSTGSETASTSILTTGATTSGEPQESGVTSDVDTTSDDSTSTSRETTHDSTTVDEEFSSGTNVDSCTEFTAGVDCDDQCPDDPEKSSPGVCGCSQPDLDTDMDGTVDCVDECPDDREKTVAGSCGCGLAEIDSDDDGVADCADECPNDPSLTIRESCGCADAPLVGRYCGPGRTCDEFGQCELQPGIGILAAGAWDTCIITPEGAVVCQGTSGEAIDFGHDFRAFQIGIGQSHACALFENGSVRCWGDALLATEYGQLGTIDFIIDADNALDPATIADVDLGGPATRISVGTNYNCAVLESGAVRCWGENTLGQLGVGNTLHRGDDEGEMPPPDVPLARRRAIEVAAGNNHSCAILEGGAVRCWGRGFGGSLGYASEVDQLVPPNEDVGLSGPAVQIDTGSSHSCAVLEDGGLQCWGYNASGQLGYGTTANIGDDETPASAGLVPVTGRAVEVMIGQGTGGRTPTYTCTRFEGGSVRCWGDNGLGGLGYRHSVTIGDNETPADAENETYFNVRLQADVPLGGPLEIGFPSIAISLAHGGGRCLMRSDAAVLCWGTEQESPVQTGILEF